MKQIGTKFKLKSFHKFYDFLNMLHLKFIMRVIKSYFKKDT